MTTTLRYGSTDATTNIETYSVSEDSTPLAGGDNSGGTGQFSVSFEDAPNTPFLHGKLLTLHDTLDGTLTGVADEISAKDGFANLDANTRLNATVKVIVAAAYVGTLEGAITYYLTRAKIYDDITLPSYARSLQVNLPAWTDVLWDRLKALCVMYHLEIALIGDAITFREPRKHNGDWDSIVTQGWSMQQQDLASTIEVCYYNYARKTNTILYGAKADSPQTISAGARKTVKVNLPVRGSVIEIIQPQFAEKFPEGNSPLSVYAIVDGKGNQIRTEDYQRLGCKVETKIGKDYRSIDLYFTGGADADRAPYSLALATAGKSKVPGLVIRGEMITENKQKVTVWTGAPAEAVTEVGATIDNPFCDTRGDAFMLGMTAAAPFSGPMHSISATVGAINRPGETGIKRRPDFDDFNVEWGNTNTFTEFETTWGVTNTFDDFENYYDYLIPEGILNQTFGNLGGARVPFRDGMYRVRSGTISDEQITFSAEEDSTFGEFESGWGKNATFDDFEAFWGSTTTLNDFGARPLWHL